MAGTVIIGCADQTLAYELRAQLAEVAELEVLALAETTGELVRAVVEREPNLVIVHDQLGPEPVHQVIRDLGLRRPSSVTLIVAGDSDPENLGLALDAGARGVLTYPLSFSEVQQRVTNALDWSNRLHELLVERDSTRSGHRALVLAVTGAKGGVGVSTVATHLAWDVRRELPDHKVLLIDLDLEKGDITSFIEARYRTSVADLAKVADDLSLRTVADAVFVHESGIHLLLPPEDVRDSEYVTAQAIRQIVGLVRQQYDLVLVDAGARVTPVQAAVVEIADEVVSITTPDLVSLRGLRRQVATWEQLAVRKADMVHVLLNRHSKADEVQPDTAARLSPSPLIPVALPDQGRKLERATNSRSPEYATDTSWWQSLRAIGRHVGIAARRADGEPDATAERSRARGRRRADGDEGSASIEFVSVFPWVAIMCLLLVQLVVVGITYMWTGYAASAAAREMAMHSSYLDVRAAALDRVPAVMEGSVQVLTDPGVGRSTVSTQVPLLVPGVAATPWRITVVRQVVMEP
ncbi:AAA family ATPase [Cellulomonas sp. S1-8]|uniref:AAA family ATPase n=1 Tax=Cellulomonas sp. S1-8 TaxID=2904790 RepID=UPI00224496A8|nr:AAA family ATPase [Cellulomonas sp. S1-8]UZN02162.1 AAA family ATPase [Cellulomonas sp. S1-8]